MTSFQVFGGTAEVEGSAFNPSNNELFIANQSENLIYVGRVSLKGGSAGGSGGIVAAVFDVEPTSCEVGSDGGHRGQDMTVQTSSRET